MKRSERLSAKDRRLLKETLKELNDLRALAGTSEDRIRELQQIVTEKQQRVEELKAAQQSAYRELDEQKIACVDLAAEKAKWRNMIAGLTKSIEDIRHRNERDFREIGEQDKRRNDLDGILERLKAELGSDEALLAELRDKTILASDEYDRSKASLHPP